MRLKPQTYAFTTIVHGRRSLFQRDVLTEMFLATLLRYRDADKFQVHGFAVMPDHVHVLLTPARDMAIERCAQLIKGGFSFAVRKEFSGEVWQEDYHAHRILDAQDYENQLRYVALNPERKRLRDYRFVHTAYGAALDPAPGWLVGSRGLKPRSF